MYLSKYKGKQIDEAVLQATDKLPVRLSEVERGVLYLEKNKADAGSVPNKMSQLTDDIGVGVTKQTVEDTKAEVKQLSTAINGQMYIVTATKTEIDAGIDPYHPITPSNLEYAVKSIGDGYYATEEQIGDISAALDELHAYAQALINGGDA